MDTFDCLFAAAECQDLKANEALKKGNSINKVKLTIVPNISIQFLENWPKACCPPAKSAAHAGSKQQHTSQNEFLA